MAETEQGDAAELAPPGTDDQAYTVELGLPPGDLWDWPASTADEQGAAAFTPVSPAPFPAAPGQGGIRSGLGRVLEAGRRGPRPFIMAAVVCAVLVCVVAAMLRVMLPSSNSRAHAAATTAKNIGSSVEAPSADGGAPVPLIGSTPALSPSAGRSPSVTARPSSAAAAHLQPSTGTGVPLGAIGDWPLTASASGSGIVADIAGSHPGTASDVQWASASGVGGYGVFNGTDSVITAPGPIVDTGPGRSYTVSAWLYLVKYDTSDFMTAVSQDGGPEGDSGFYLSYSGPADRWVFLVPGASGPAASTNAPALNTWTHLVGVYDADDDQVRLYVDGGLAGTASYDSTFAGSDGSLVIGRAMYAGGEGDWFRGDIRDVEVFDQPLTTAAVDSLG